jgi:hypothetical protein
MQFETDMREVKQDKACNIVTCPVLGQLEFSVGTIESLCRLPPAAGQERAISRQEINEVRKMAKRSSSESHYHLLGSTV